MKRFELYKDLWQGRNSLWIGIVSVTVLQAAYMMYVRQEKEIYFNTAAFFEFHVDAFDAGFIVQQLVIPVALLFIISNLPFFKRLMNAKARRGDKALLFAALAFTQLAFFAYTYSFGTNDFVALDSFFVVLAAGFLGGWLMGLGIGVLTFMLIGVRALLSWPPEDMGFTTILLDYFVLDESTLFVIWQGTTMGLFAELLGKQRFLPLVALLLGFLIELSGRSIAAPAQNEYWNWTQHNVAVALASAVALALIALLVRNVQMAFVRQQAESAELAITQAELRALRAQINPHFIFNSLNTIRYFVRIQPDKARDLLLSLSEIFQRSLKSGDFVPLKEELAYVEAYLALEKARLDDRLSIQWILPDDRVLDLFVPTLILQPLVENAVLHGIAPKKEGGKLSITIETWDDELVMQVRDDGEGFDAKRWREQLEEGWQSHKERPSIGIKNIDNRLRMLYGETYRLKLESDKGIGTRVQITLPMVQALMPKAIFGQEQAELASYNYSPKALEGNS